MNKYYCTLDTGMACDDIELSFKKGRRDIHVYTKTSFAYEMFKANNVMMAVLEVDKVLPRSTVRIMEMVNSFTYGVGDDSAIIIITTAFGLAARKAKLREEFYDDKEIIYTIVEALRLVNKDGELQAEGFDKFKNLMQRWVDNCSDSDWDKVIGLYYLDAYPNSCALCSL